MTRQYRNHNIRFSMTDDEGVQAWERLHSEEVEQSFKSQKKLLSNLPALAAMYQMQQAFFQAGLQAGGIMSYPYQQGYPGTVTSEAVKPVAEPAQSSEQPSVAAKQELAEPEENEFLDYSFGV